MKRPAKHIILFIAYILVSVCSLAQKNLILDTENFRSLQLVVNHDELLPPIVRMGGNWHLTIGFDEMSHSYRRLRYHIDHCEADWSVSDQIFESDYLEGLNDQLIEDYEKSYNTVQIYTHYKLTLPNEDVRLLLSGNYRITIYDEDEEDTPLLQTEFCVVEPQVQVGGTVEGDTDIDFQKDHQQVSISLKYGTLRVIDPLRELKVFVTQNRRQDLLRQVQPNIQNQNGVEFTHQRALIFPGSNECHKFELLDIQHANMGVDNIRWYEPYYHATLFSEFPTRHYSSENDQNGAFVMRNRENEDNETSSEYAFVHFRLKTPPIPGGPIYVHGNWVNNWPSDEYKMEYNAEEGEYQAAVFLKQGYYDYRFMQIEEDGTVSTQRTDGNFFQTRNEYQILVYYKEVGGRYDRLVGETRIGDF